MSRIPDAYIADVLDRVNIVDVIHPRVTLKSTGGQHVACCPFHDEKTPSFTVNEAKQFYFCYGCGATGDAIKFLQEFDGCDFRAAVDILAATAGVSPPDDTAVNSAEWQAKAEARAARTARLQAERDFLAAAMRDNVAAVAARAVADYSKPVGNSPYLGRKKIKSCGALFAREPFLIVTNLAAGTCELVDDATQFKRYFARRDEIGVRKVGRGDLLIPASLPDGTVRNLQIITKTGKKRHLKCAQKQGTYFVIPGDGAGPVVLVEGFATGVSVAMATGYTVVVGWDTGNMVHLAGGILPATFPGRLFLVAGDFDHSKQDNVGAEKATAAAALLGCPVVFPSFPEYEGETDRTDFNDLHVEFGMAEVAMQVVAGEAGPVPELEPPPVDHAPPGLPGPSLDGPPPWDEPPPDSADYEPVAPAPPEVERPTLDQALGRYAFVVDDGRVWDNNGRKFLKQKAVKDFLGAEVFTDWRDSDKRRNVNAADVAPLAKAAAGKGVQGLREALERYVYLNPSQNVWDCRERRIVAVNDLRCAIASCFTDWIKHPNRLEIPVDNLVFDPEQKTPTEDHINRFTGLNLEPARNDGSCQNIIKMMQQLCNNEPAVYHWLFQWLAYPLRHIGAKMRTAVLMHSSVHGSGKSWFFDGVMREIYGDYCRVLGQTQLESQYNDWMSECMFGVFEEVLSRGQKYAHTGTLKQMITGKKYRVEKKFLSGWEEANHMNAVFLSNEVQPLPVEPSDRRFLVVWPLMKLMEELKAGVKADLEQGGAAAFYGWLLAYPMDDDFDEFTEPPMTEAKERLIDFGRPSWEIFHIEWSRGETDWPYIPVQVKCLFKAYERWCSQRREHVMGQNRFSGFIASKERRRRDVHYEYGVTKGKGVFFVVGSPEAGETQQEWFGRSVEQWEEAARKVQPDLQDAG